MTDLTKDNETSEMLRLEVLAKGQKTKDKRRIEDLITFNSDTGIVSAFGYTGPLSEKFTA